MNLKCLPLEYWMKLRYHRNDTVSHGNAYTEINPILNRDGYYNYGVVCWFEVDNQAWLCDNNGGFQFSMKIHHAAELRPEQIRGLKAIHDTNIATKSQKQNWSDYCDYLSCREISRNSRLIFNRKR